MSHRLVACCLGALVTAAATVAWAFPHQVPEIEVASVTASHVLHCSESPPPKTDCDDPQDLGRIVVHSSGKSGSIYVCAQGANPNYEKARWFVVRGELAP